MSPKNIALTVVNVTTITAGLAASTVLGGISSATGKLNDAIVNKMFS